MIMKAVFSRAPLFHSQSADAGPASQQGLGFYSGRETAVEHSWIVAALHHQPGAPGP